MSDREELYRWFRLIWRNTEGSVKLAYRVEKNLVWDQVMFNWPSQIVEITDWVLAKNGQGAEVYYAPAIYTDSSSGKSSNVKGSWVLWVEFDGNAPAKWDLPKTQEPSVRLQSSSPGHQHCYWLLDEFISREDLEAKNRALSYELEADTSGWDAAQVLRPPCTTNHGHSRPERKRKYPVEVIYESTTFYSPDTFEVPAYFVDAVKNAIDLADLPSLALVLAKGKWPEGFFESFFVETIPKDRSVGLMEIGYFGAEAGLSDAEIYVLVETADSRWHKYTSRTPDRRFNILANIVERARFKHPNGQFNFVARFNNKPQKIVYTNREFLDLKVEVKWEMKDLLTQNGSGIIAGEPGVGKTQLYNQFGLSLAMGAPFLTWQNVCEPRRTMLLELEMPLAGFQKFLGLAQSKLTTSQLNALDQNLLISPLSSALPLDLPEGRKFLIDLLQEHKPEVVLIDSLSKMTGKKSLNDDVPMRELNDWLQDVRNRYGVTIIIVHHTKKRQLDKKGHEPNGQDDLFGSRFLTADMDFILSCYSVKPKGSIYITNPKNRYSEEHAPITVFRQPDLSFTVQRVHNDDDEGGTFLDDFFNRRQGSAGESSS